MRARVLETWVVGLEVVPSAGEKATREGATVCAHCGQVCWSSGDMSRGRRYRHLLDTWLLEIIVVP